jgi:hypothetical protein
LTCSLLEAKATLEGSNISLNAAIALPCHSRFFASSPKHYIHSITYKYSSTPAVTLIALSTASLLTGYYLGKPHGAPTGEGKEKAADDVSQVEPAPEEVDSEEEDESLADGDLNAIQAGLMEPCKMVGLVMDCQSTDQRNNVVL